MSERDFAVSNLLIAFNRLVESGYKNLHPSPEWRERSFQRAQEIWDEYNAEAGAINGTFGEDTTNKLLQLKRELGGGLTEQDLQVAKRLGIEIDPNERRYDSS